MLLLKCSFVSQIGISPCKALQALFLIAAPPMTLFSFLFPHTMLRIVIEYDFILKLSLFLKSKFCCSNVSQIVNSVAQIDYQLHGRINRYPFSGHGFFGFRCVQKVPPPTPQTALVGVRATEIDSSVTVCARTRPSRFQIFFKVGNF